MKKIFVSAPLLSGNEKKYVNDCLDSTWISSNGKYIDLFEKQFSKFTSYKHAISVSNGTVALHVALLALGIKRGDEVITPTLSYVASTNAILYCGAKPVFIDSESDTGNLDVTKVERLITSKTKAIMPVHLYGHPADMDPIIKLARKYSLFVIEDAAEAIGAKYKNKHVGALGNIGTFSFYGNKNITTGEGGMIVTDDDALAAKVRLLKGQGMDPKRRYWHPIVGYNYRMTNIQAAIGLAQLEKIDTFLKKRSKIFESYNSHFKKAKFQKLLTIPATKNNVQKSYWMYTLNLSSKLASKRDLVMQKLLEYNIETRPVFYPIHTMPPYARFGTKFPKAVEFSANGLSLPTHPLLTASDISYIADSLHKVLTLI